MHPRRGVAVVRGDAAHGAEHALDPYQLSHRIEQFLFVLLRDARVVADAHARGREVARRTRRGRIGGV